MIAYLYWVLTGKGPFRRELERTIEDVKKEAK